MVMDVFEALLQELGEALDIEGLRPDEHNTCLIEFPNGIEVQIEPYEKGEFLLILCKLGEIPHGRYRSDVFKEALKANSLPYPRYGIFAYSEQSNQLILYKLVSLKELTGEKVASYLEPFMEKVLMWKEHLDRGDVPLAETMGGASTRPRSPMGIFGLQP